MRSFLNIIYNCHWVVPGVALRSAQPYMGFWEHHLSENGIGALINLRGVHPTWRWWRREHRCCRKLGIEHINLGLNSRMLPSRAHLFALLNAFDRAPRPFMIKCSGGQDRTSFASALFLLHTKGWGAVGAAKRQFSSLPYLHIPRSNQKWLCAFIDFAESDARGDRLEQWVRDHYDPIRFRSWLYSQGMSHSFLGIAR
jgi:hypothetical protein